MGRTVQKIVYPERDSNLRDFLLACQSEHKRHANFAFFFCNPVMHRTQNAPDFFLFVFFTAGISNNILPILVNFHSSVSKAHDLFKSILGTFPGEKS